MQICTELKILHEVRSPYVVGFYGSYFTDRYVEGIPAVSNPPGSFYLSVRCFSAHMPNLWRHNTPLSKCSIK